MTNNEIVAKLGNLCNAPACGTFGFMIVADRHIKDKTNDLLALTEKEADFQKKEAFTGGELIRRSYK